MANKSRKEKIEQWAKTTREEFPDHLKAAAGQLREEVAHLEDDFGTQAKKLAQDLEQVADNLEKRAEKQLETATDEVQEHPWLSILAALGIGIIIGFLLRNLSEQ